MYYKELIIQVMESRKAKQQMAKQEATNTQDWTDKQRRQGPQRPGGVATGRTQNPARPPPQEGHHQGQQMGGSSESSQGKEGEGEILWLLPSPPRASHELN